ncbi:hypothetical protein ACFSFZ_04585 [Mixta tenebrionis]|uniref:Uncharacterized protein n=1 Tax=Mixta tenebrionis TaxID=2562439 RepID=A0A506V794_9GAMM|nr:hypothetical protein [Mixta tenebrionis]TPW41416.1 hypothetical protein FKM52_14290 [Mixta tenebrionis]
MHMIRILDEASKSYLCRGGLNSAACATLCIAKKQVWAIRLITSVGVLYLSDCFGKSFGISGAVRPFPIAAIMEILWRLLRRQCNSNNNRYHIALK